MRRRDTLLQFRRTGTILSLISLVATTLICVASRRLRARNPRSVIETQAPTADGRIAEILTRRVLAKQPGRYIGWPSIATTRDGDLLVVFSGDRDAHVSPDGKTQMIRSSDNGRTWGGVVTIHDFPIDDRDAGILRTRKGTMIVSWFTGPPYGHALQGHYVRRSTDDGKTWGEPIRTRSTTPHGPVELSDGRLVFLGHEPHSSHVQPPSYNGRAADSPYRVVVEESRDDGKTWKIVSTFPVPPAARMLSFDEPHLVQTRSGKLVALFRDCNPPHRMWQSESDDGGKKWSTPHRTDLHGLPPHLVRLRSGWLLATYAKRWAPFGTFVSVSVDEGKTWLAADEIQLSEAPNSDLGYPASVELEDGTIWTVYYEIDKRGEKPCLKGTHWRLDAAAVKGVARKRAG